MIGNESGLLWRLNLVPLQGLPFPWKVTVRKADIIQGLCHTTNRCPWKRAQPPDSSVSLLLPNVHDDEQLQLQ